jgi:hypothetical protein
MGLAATAMVAGALPASALSKARQVAAAEVLRAVREGWARGVPDADIQVITTAWRHAGADLRQADADIAANLGRDLADSRARRLVTATCGSVLRLPAEQPVAGDLVAYKLSPGGATVPWRLGMFVSAVDLVVLEPGSNRLIHVVRQEVTGDDSQVLRPLATEPNSAVICRFKSELIPGGDDLSASPGRVAIIDPRTTLEHLGWAVAHPRDADTSAMHQIAKVIAAAGDVLGKAVSGVVDLVGAAITAAVRLLGPFGAGVFGVWALLGTTFDGRLAHRVLTGVTVALLTVVATMALGPAGVAVALAAVFGTVGMAHLGVPFLGHIGAAIWSVSSFITSVVTGVDDSEHASFLAVGVALVSDLAILAKPLALAGRLAGARAALGGVAPWTAHVATSGILRLISTPARLAARAGGAVLGAFSTVGDALQLRPAALHRFVSLPARLDRAGWVRRIRGLPALPSGPALSAEAVSLRVGTVAADSLSLAWRPASLLSDLSGHAGELSGWLARELADGGRSWPYVHPGVRRFLAGLDTERRRRVLEAALPKIDAWSQATHFHSGARTTAAQAGGQAHNSPGSAPFPGPDERLLAELDRVLQDLMRRPRP